MCVCVDPDPTQVPTALCGSAFQGHTPLPGTMSTSLKSLCVGAGHRAAGLILEIALGGLSHPLSNSAARLRPCSQGPGGQSRVAAHTGKAGKEGEHLLLCLGFRVGPGQEEGPKGRGSISEVGLCKSSQFQPES